MLKGMPNPLALLRNSLNDRFTPPVHKIRDMAERKGLVVHYKGEAAAPSEGPSRSTSSLANVRSSDYLLVAPGRGAERVLERFSAVLKELKISFFVGGASNEYSVCINVLATDMAFVVGALDHWFQADNDIKVGLPDGSVMTPEGFRKQIRTANCRSFSLLCSEKLTASKPTRFVACSEIQVNAWVEVEHYGAAPIFESSLTTPYVRRLKGDTVNKLQSGALDFHDLSKDVQAYPKFPVDVVYTWVNDQDDEWLELKDKYKGIPTGSGRAHHDERFKNRDELKFSLRSIDMFAPFVRNVYIVTNGQVPAWLNQENERVKVVTHEQIYRNREYLPTFNSSGIETQLHHIPGLSEHFLYFNDDFFLGSLCEANDFFLPNGVIKCFPTEQRVFEHDVDDESEEYIIADANAIRLMKKRNGSYTRDIMMHVPYPSSKTLLQNMEDEFQAEFDACASSRFRSKQDLRPIAFMQYHTGLHDKLVQLSKISHRYLALWKPTIDKQFEGVSKTRKYKTFCINDVGVQPEKSAYTDKLVHDFLNDYFPFKSSFEI